MCLLFGQTVKTRGLEDLSWRRFVPNAQQNSLCTLVFVTVQINIFECETILLHFCIEGVFLSYYRE